MNIFYSIAKFWRCKDVFSRNSQLRERYRHAEIIAVYVGDVKVNAYLLRSYSVPALSWRDIGYDISMISSNVLIL